MKTHKKLDAFSRRSLLRVPLLPLLGPIAYALAPNSKECVKQYPEAAGNVEFAVSNFMRAFARHPIKVWPLLSTIIEWVRSYFGAKRAQRYHKQYLIYTKLDDTVPFRPEWDTLYVYMVSQIGYLTKEVLDRCSLQEVKYIARMFTYMTAISAEVYTALPTRMIRLQGHNRISLKAVQAIDDPLNCGPSLHIAYSVVIDNLLSNVLDTASHHPRMWQDVRIASTGMFDSVLYTKQHAVVCIATGMLAAEIAFKRFYPHKPFTDFTTLFEHMSNEVPYDEVGRLYRDAKRFYEKTNHLSSALRILFDQEKYPFVPARIAEKEYARLVSQDTVRRMKK